MKKLLIAIGLIVAGLGYCGVQLVMTKRSLEPEVARVLVPNASTRVASQRLLRAAAAAPAAAALWSAR